MGRDETEVGPRAARGPDERETGARPIFGIENENTPRWESRGVFGSSDRMGDTQAGAKASPAAGRERESGRRTEQARSMVGGPCDLRATIEL